MSKLTDLMKQHDLDTTSDLHSKTAIDVKALTEVYGVGNFETHSSHGYSYSYYSYDKTPKVIDQASITCKNKCWHRVYSLKDEAGVYYWAYSWPGQNYLLSKKLLTLDLLHELGTLKDEALAEARKKRFNTVKSARDAVRVLFRDLEIKCSMASGCPRIECGPFELEFDGDKEGPNVKVNMVYRDYYVNKIELTSLTVADPSFNKKALAIIQNGKNLNKLMLGEAQPEIVKSAGTV